MRLSFSWSIATAAFAALVVAGSVAGSSPGSVRPADITKPVVSAAATPERITVYPPTIALDSRRAYRQLVVTGYFHGEPHDLTSDATYTVSRRTVATTGAGRVAATGDGQAVVTVSAGGQSVQVPLTVAHTAAPDPVRFQFETLPVLTKQGCANGSCHGSPHGKGGFSLSLFGYDPRIDRIALTRDGFNRRVNIQEPTESLMLKKPLLQVPHVGGKRLLRNHTPYQVLSAWINEGAHADLSPTQCTKITIAPGAARTLHAPFLRQQLSVLAAYSDGTTHDVSAIATYETSDASVATVDADGLITGHSRGQAAISVRYLDKLQSVYITVVEDIPGFVWHKPAEANFVDRLADAKLQQLQYQPAPVCDDSTFLRRAALDLTGLLPTTDRTRRFLADKTPDKRARLIDELLASDEYARFWASKKSDLMRVSPARLKEGRAAQFANWITRSVRENVPYDRFAREILTATGDGEKEPAANYFLAIPTMEERTEMTAQVFMGTRVECTKCHNHPFENWTMRDYYSIAAVFARLQTDNNEVTLAKTGEALHPTTQEVMAPWGMTAAQQKVGMDRRAAFALWLTRPGNPYFAPVEMNRTWAALMGRGIVEPVDDFRSSNPPANPALLAALATEFEQSGYDRKHMIRLICNSQTYQRVATTGKLNASDDRLFSHAYPRLLTAEQLKDAIGLTTQSLAPPETGSLRFAQCEREVATRTAALEAGYPAWVAQKTDEIARAPFWQGGWYLAGPFPAGRAGRGRMGAQAGPESGPVDLSAHYGAVRWQIQPDFRDGDANPLGKERGQINYVYRRVHAATARTVNVEIAASDTFQVWQNNTLLTPKPVKGVQKMALALVAGDNTLLFKVVNMGARSSFSFRVADDKKADGAEAQPSGADAIPGYIVDFLAIPAASRTAAQNALMHRLYIEQDKTVRRLTDQMARITSRTDYATQRPFGDNSAFTTTFGQPKRETACTCERQNAPTLLQALELMNGETTYDMAKASAARFQPLTDDQILDTLYLSGLCRYPTASERTTAHSYLSAHSADREGAIADLVWAVVNKQEFLFQH